MVATTIRYEQNKNIGPINASQELQTMNSKITNNELTGQIVYEK